MNKLTAEKCREQFEAWLKSTGKNPPYATKRGYWEIWKASRSTMEIEIPAPACRYADDSYKAYTRKQVEDILAELGVKAVEEEA